jgi:pseudouridine 5'-phosphatase
MGIDTEKIYEKIIREIAQNYNKEYPWVTRMKLLGTTERRSVINFVFFT